MKTILTNDYWLFRNFDVFHNGKAKMSILIQSDSVRMPKVGKDGLIVTLRLTLYEQNYPYTPFHDFTVKKCKDYIRLKQTFVIPIETSDQVEVSLDDNHFVVMDPIGDVLSNIVNSIMDSLTTICITCDYSVEVLDALNDDIMDAIIDAEAETSLVRHMI